MSERLKDLAEWASGDYMSLTYVMRDSLLILLVIGVALAILIPMTISISEYRNTEEYLASHPNPIDVSCNDMYDFIMGDRTLYKDINASWEELGVHYNARCKA